MDNKNTIHTNAVENKNIELTNSEKHNKKLRKTIIVTLIVAILAILTVPVKEVHEDGGSISYTSLTYKVMKWNQTFGITDTEVYWFPNNLKDYDELDTTTRINAFIIKLDTEKNEMLVQNRYEGEVNMFRMPIDPYFDRYGEDKEQLKISDEIFVGFTDITKGEDGVYTAGHIYGLDWFQGTNVVDEPVLMKNDDIFRVQIDGYVHLDTGKTDDTRTQKNVELPDGFLGYFGQSIPYMINEDGTYSVYYDDVWKIVEYDAEHEWNIAKEEELVLIEAALNGETSDINADGTPKEPEKESVILTKDDIDWEVEPEEDVTIVLEIPKE